MTLRKECGTVLHYELIEGAKGANVIGDVGTFVTLLDNIFQIFIVVKDFFPALRTTPSIYPTDR